MLNILQTDSFSGYEQNFKQRKHFEKANPRLYFGRGAVLIGRKIYISMDISIMALSYRIIFCREFFTMVTKMKKLRIRRRITAS